MILPPVSLYPLTANLALSVTQTFHPEANILEFPILVHKPSYLTVLSSVMTPAALSTALVQQVTSMRTTTPTTSHVHQGADQSPPPADSTIMGKSFPSKEKWSISNFHNIRQIINFANSKAKLCTQILLSEKESV